MQPLSTSLCYLACTSVLGEPRYGTKQYLCACVQVGRLQGGVPDPHQGCNRPWNVLPQPHVVLLCTRSQLEIARLARLLHPSVHRRIYWGLHTPPQGH